MAYIWLHGGALASFIKLLSAKAQALDNGVYYDFAFWTGSKRQMNYAINLYRSISISKNSITLTIVFDASKIVTCILNNYVAKTDKPGEMDRVNIVMWPGH